MKTLNVPLKEKPTCLHLSLWLQEQTSSLHKVYDSWVKSSLDHPQTKFVDLKLKLIQNVLLVALCSHSVFGYKDEHLSAPLTTLILNVFFFFFFFLVSHLFLASTSFFFFGLIYEKLIIST